MSRMRLSDAERFSTATLRLLMVCSNRFWTAPRSPRRVDVAVIADWTVLESVMSRAAVETDPDRSTRQHVGVGGAHLEVQGAVAEQVHTVELRGGLDPVDLARQRVELGLQGGLRVGVLRAVVVLHRELVHALEHGVDLGQRTFSGLGDRDAVLGVAHGGLQATDLEAQALGDGQAGRVVGGAVDPVAAGQLLQGLGQRALGHRQVAVGVEGVGVGVDAKTHGGSFLDGESRAGVRPWTPSACSSARLARG